LGKKREVGSWELEARGWKMNLEVGRSIGYIILSACLLKSLIRGRRPKDCNLTGWNL